MKSTWYSLAVISGGFDTDMPYRLVTASPTETDVVTGAGSSNVTESIASGRLASAAARASDPTLIWDEPQHPKGDAATTEELEQFRAQRQADIDADAPPDTKDDHNEEEGSSAQAAVEDTPASPCQEQAAEASVTKWTL